uniref:Uncharacterized protein n=1 Tax=Anguilla anguilla TaxID=7936 RepID=A0A0E9PKM2_ANGAN
MSPCVSIIFQKPFISTFYCNQKKEVFLEIRSVFM